MKNPIFKYAVAAALTGALVVAAATPSDARHARRAVVVVAPVVTPGFGGTSSGSYYSRIYNPRFGYVPELGYSNAVSFRIYPYSD
jgi:hypothetical protein